MRRVVTAMSGGVDSSVAALLLHQQQYDVIGISMQVWDYRNHGGSLSKATCCAPSDFSDARQVAAKIGIPYYVFDFEDVFRERVIDSFVHSYKNGLTPNPCVECNRKVKFKELRNRAETIGAETVATGHYARIIKSEDGYHLLRGKDDSKDQSYFLWAMSQQELAKTIFPVGDMSKSEVREIAKQFGLVTAEKAESQDICFVSGKLSNFLGRMGIEPKKGKILKSNGEQIGSHDGIQSFTVGQRRGVNVGGQDSPLYVIDINPRLNQVVVGDKSELQRNHFYVSEVSFCSPEAIKWWNSDSKTMKCLAQLRYRHRGVAVSLSKENGLIKASFTADWSAVSPGQFAVFYNQDNVELLGGGRIMHDSEIAGQLSADNITDKEGCQQSL